MRGFRIDWGEYLRGEPMKLAEALAERSDCQNRLDELKKRVLRSARVQEGEAPAEDSAELLAETDRVFSRLLELVSGINRTNAKTAFDENQTISDAIAARDLFGKKRDMLAAIAEAASTRQDRYSKSEVKFVATVSISQLQKQVDQLSKQYREVDTRLQELNWSTDLV
jgi:uncharacterized protein DUF6847